MPGETTPDSNRLTSGGLIFGRATVGCGHHDVLDQGSLEQLRVVRGHQDRGADRRRVHLGQRHPVEFDRTAVRIRLASQTPQDGGGRRRIGHDNPQQFAGGGGERQASQRPVGHVLEADLAPHRPGKAPRPGSDRRGRRQHRGDAAGGRPALGELRVHPGEDR